MAYAQGSGDGGSKMPWIIGGAALLYLWYEGYLAAWFPSVFGATTVANTTPTTSVATGSTTPTVNQTAGTPTVSQVTSPTNMIVKRPMPITTAPIHVNPASLLQ
jgi:hypothetical protein